MLKVENLQKSFFTEEIETVALNGVSFLVVLWPSLSPLVLSSWRKAA